MKRSFARRNVDALVERSARWLKGLAGLDPAAAEHGKAHQDAARQATAEEDVAPRHAHQTEVPPPLKGGLRAPGDEIVDEVGRRTRPTDRAPAFDRAPRSSADWSSFAAPPRRREPAWAPQISLLGQRIDLLNDRLELLKDRVEANTHESRARMESPSAAYPGQELQQLAKRVSQLENGLASPEPTGRPGSWRPPPIPGFSVPHRSSSTPPGVIRPPESMLMGPVVSGILSDLSLASLLGLFELERNTGVLVVEADGNCLELELRGGQVVRAYLNQSLVPAVKAIHEALSWEAGSFGFRRSPVVGEEEEPRSVNAVLLEASRLQDEAAAF